MPHDYAMPVPPQLLTQTHTQKVLVIDDVEMNAMLISSVVSTLCDVMIATSGEQALEMAKQHRPELILLDVLMPGMDGFEVFRQLKNDPRTASIPVIFLTGVSDVSAEEVGLNMGAVDFIAKPFRTAVLLARVRNHLELVRQRQLLERLSHSDGLTGVANLRYFNAMLSSEFSRMKRHGRHLGLLMLEVDGFNAFNDQYGHLRGDECLQKIADVMTNCLARPGDLVARYGGAEFVCLLPETTHENCVLLAQKIQTGIADLRIPDASAQDAAFVTASIAVAAAHTEQLSNGQQLLGMANARLHWVRHSARNCIIDSD